MSVLVLKEWRANNTPLDEDGHLVRIAGRKGGLISWFLSLTGVDPTTYFFASADRLEIIGSSLSGKVHRIIPLWSVSAASYGYYKPWKQAYLLFISLCICGVGMSFLSSEYSGDMNMDVFFMSMVVAFFASLLYYILSRTFTLSFTEHSGHTSVIRYKSSVIEGVDVNENEALYICDLVQALIDRKFASPTVTDYADPSAQK